MKQRLIDANELRKNLSSRYMNELYPDWRVLPELTKMRIEMLAKEFRFALDHAPTIDAVTVVHGRWIWHEDKWEHECSNCHCGFDYDKTYLLFDHGYEYARYCPNCGAKMDGGAERDQSTK